DQFGVEAFGMTGPDIDAEVILLSARLWRELGISDHVRLEINNIGSAEDRRHYGDALKTFLQSRAAELDEDSRRRLDSNPLRILDSKHPGTREILQQAPVLADYTNPQSQTHYQQLKTLLSASGISFQENRQLVRGLDYYNNSVFEWITDALGAQGTVCAGGRYDGLVAQLGGKPTPAVGFASGKERLVLLLEELKLLPAEALTGVDLFIAVLDDDLEPKAVQIAETLRNALPHLKLQLNCGGGKYSSQMKKAFNSGARLAVILEAGGEPGSAERVKLRHLDDSAEPLTVPLDELEAQVRKQLGF
ncbi:MAG: ATP phosphoribosyltransferase regulatory subunit, partial [Pseudohongiellaceae bacterium]